MGALRIIRGLVAEENPFIATLLSQGINTGLRARVNLPPEVRFQFDHALDGAEALSRLEKGAYDILICDVALPIVDGLEVMRRVRAVSRLRDLRVIALSSSGLARQAALVAGADRFLEKPMPLSTLVRTIAELLAL